MGYRLTKRFTKLKNMFKESIGVHVTVSPQCTQSLQYTGGEARRQTTLD